jgi:ribose-phosphate pyrophosphokinase
MSVIPIVFGGNSNPLLVRNICDALGVEQGKAFVGSFSDGEHRIELNENVRRREVFVVQSTSHPAAEHLMELCLLIDAIKRAAACKITAVVPYFGYARQDRIRRGQRVPISAGVAARMIQGAGAHHVIVMELHSGQTMDAFGVPVDHLYSSPVLSRHMRSVIKEEGLSDVVFISPDAGGLPRARKYAQNFNARVGFIDKRRENPNESEVMNVVAKVDGCPCIVVDDMADTCGTLTKAVCALRDKGASKVIAYCTHPVLSGEAMTRLEDADVRLVVTDTIPLSDRAEASGRIKVVSIASVFAEAITKNCNGESIREMFD